MTELKMCRGNVLNISSPKTLRNRLTPQGFSIMSAVPGEKRICPWSGKEFTIEMHQNVESRDVWTFAVYEKNEGAARKRVLLSGTGTLLGRDLMAIDDDGEEINIHFGWIDSPE